MLSAEELHQRGRAAGNAGRHAAARQLLERALSRASAADTIAHIRVSLAYTASELGTVDEGIRLCRQAIAIEGVSSHVRGVAYSQLGLLLARSGHGPSALEALETALSLLDDDANYMLGNVYNNLGNIHLQRSDSRHARPAFTLAADHYEQAGDLAARGKARHNLACVDVLDGQAVAALAQLEATRPTLIELGPFYEALNRMTVGEAFASVGMLDAAASALQEAAAAFARRRITQDQAETLLALAGLRIGQDEPREARKTARRAARLFAGRGSDAWAARARAVALSAEVLTGVRRAALLDEAADIAAQLKAQGLVHDASAVLLQSARMAIRLDDLPTARARVRSVRQRADAPLENRLLQHQVKAEFAKATRRRKPAMQHVRDGLAELHDWQSSFGSLDLQSSLVGHGRGLAAEGLRLAVEDGRPEVVFEWTERARALTSRVAAVRPPDNPEGAAQLQELRELHAQIRAADADGRPVTTLLRTASELQQKIREKAWHDPGSGLVTEPTQLDTVMAELAAHDGVMVTHLVTRDHDLQVLVATSDDARVIDLGGWDDVRHILRGLQADLDVSAAHLPEPLRAVVRDSLADRLATLSDHLLGPVADLLTDRPVLVVPTGGLAGTPWTLLPHLRGLPVTQPRSATLWVAHQHGPDHPRRKAAFVAGPRVERADEEVHRAAAAWGAQGSVLTAADASADQVSVRAADADVLHVAAHGRHSADNPLFSGLELADGPWFGYDIDRLPHVPRTVVLSACELGRSTVRWGEEAIGMTQAWLHAGACTVIASPASVDDDVACEVLAETHKGLAAGQQPAYALADATRSLGLQDRSSFMCFGAGW